MSETIFHKIMRKEIPARIVYEDEQVMAIQDVNPVAPQHLLVIPKKTIPGLSAVTPADEQLLGHMLLVVNEIAKTLELSENGYRVVINTGSDGGQTVFQLHMHLLGGRSFSWPPG